MEKNAQKANFLLARNALKAYLEIRILHMITATVTFELRPDDSLTVSQLQEIAAAAKEDGVDPEEWVRRKMIAGLEERRSRKTVCDAIPAVPTAPAA